jgi:hypothetical protein
LIIEIIGNSVSFTVGDKQAIMMLSSGFWAQQWV